MRGNAFGLASVNFGDTLMLDSIFLVAAVVGGTIIVCQFALTLFGLGQDGADIGHHGGDFHVSGHGHDLSASHHSGTDGTNGDADHPDSSWLFGIVTFRTLVAAAAFFGLSGKAALSAGFAQPTALVIALLVGYSAMYGMYRLMQLIGRLASSGNERIANAVGRKATVYVSIPAARQGKGKVQLSMQNRIVEFQAVTEDEQPLKSGQAVEVVGIVDSDVVEVRSVAQPVEA